MKAKIIAMSLIAWIMLFSPCAARSLAATQTQEIKFFEGSPWIVMVEVQADVDATGKTSASISKCSPKNASAWANYKASAKITRARLGGSSSDQKRVIVEMIVEFSGQANRFSSHVNSAHQSIVTWASDANGAKSEDQEALFMLFAKDHPELGKLESVRADETPAEFSGTGAPVETPPAPHAGQENKGRTFIREASGIVRIIRKDRTIVKAEDNMELEIGDRISTASNGKVELVLSGNTKIRVRPDSEFVIPEDKRNTKEKINFIKMMKGILCANARKDDDSLRVATPSAVVGCRGTEFIVSFLDGVTSVEVIEGTVWLAEAEGMPEMVLKAGQKGSIPSQNTGIAGQWKSDFGTVTLAQSGDIVTGTYTHDNGKIEGKLEGDTLRGKWSEGPSYNPPKDAGEMELVFSQDQKSFKGNWRYGFGGTSWNGAWKGARLESQ